MRWSLLVTASLLLPRSCHRSTVRQTPRVVSRVEGSWRMAPAMGPLVRVASEQYLQGALRWENSTFARAPFSSTPLVAAAQTSNGWLFASSDGTLFQSTTFLGTLHRLGAFSLRARPLPSANGEPPWSTIASKERLVFFAENGAVFTASSQGEIQTLPFRAHAGTFLDALHGVFLSEQGVLQFTSDGGRTFRVLSLPSEGLALTIAAIDERVLVYATQGTFRITNEGTLEPIQDAPVLASWVTGTPRPAYRSEVFLPADPRDVAALSEGRVLVQENERLVVRSTVDGSELDREAPPGQRCSLYSSGAGPRARCSSSSYAAALFAREAPGRWVSLRDEARAEPLGPLVFDTRSGAFVVGASCTQSPTFDARALCVYLDGRTPRSLTAPFAALPLAMEGGSVLVLEQSASEHWSRAALWSGGQWNEFVLPVPREYAMQARFFRGVVTMLAPNERNEWKRFSLRREGTRNTWEQTPLPEGSSGGLLHRDFLLAYGSSPNQAWIARAQTFVPVAAAIEGAVSTPFWSPSSPYCVSNRCRITEDIEFVSTRETPTVLLSREHALSESSGARTFAQYRVQCELQATPVRPAPELDHGMAVSGYAMEPRRTNTSVQLRWEGLGAETLRSAPVQAMYTHVRGAAPMGTSTPLGALEACTSDGQCVFYAATAAGLRPLVLHPGPTLRGLRVALGTADTLLVLLATRGLGTTLYELVVLDARTGAERTRRIVHSSAPDGFVFLGTHEEHNGLWSFDARQTLTFHPAEEAVAGAEVTLPASLEVCRENTPARGLLRWTLDNWRVSGEGWASEPGEWQQEVLLEERSSGLCVRSVSAGESRDERELERMGVQETAHVRSFVVEAAPDGSLTGRAWGARRTNPLHCTVQRSSR